MFGEPYRNELKAILKIRHNYDIEVVGLEVPVDYIHMVVRSIPEQSPSQIMQVIESVSAGELFKLSLEIKRRHFWGDKVWARSYFVETIGNSSEEFIRALCVRSALSDESE
ncbi:MAG: IS200/IS605 family transposase [Pseudomonadales bacterium]|nr:IS200/IS605 family transposase [Pseudomonadales bacterium]